MPAASIRLFNPFHLKHGSAHEWHVKVQEVIYYGDSRFRQALADISKADSRHQLWMQGCLKDELGFIMSYVGIATSSGFVVEVPMVLRSLSASLASVSDADLPIPFDLGLIAMLDSGTNDEEFGRIVKSYALAWWKGTRRPADGGTLTAKTLDQCLNEHRLMLLETMAGDPMGKQMIIPIPSLQLSIAPDVVPETAPKLGSDTAAILGPDTAPILGSGHGSAFGSEKCPQCSIYHSIAGDLFNELTSLKNFVSGMVETTCTETELIPRRALGFYSLHEKVLLKELHSESQSAAVKHTLPGTRKGKISHQVRLQANEELERIRAMPTDSHKWTWGETLTKDEVQSIRHVSKRRVHTGYETTLKPGRMSGEWSSQQSTPIRTGTDQHSLISADPQQPPPPTRFQYPELFGSSNRQATGSGLNDTGADTLSTGADISHDYVASPPNSPTRTHRLRTSPNPVAHKWIYIDSEDESNSPSPNPPTIAQKWINMESDSDAESLSPSHPTCSPDIKESVNMEIDHTSQQTMSMKGSPKMGVAERWINMASDEESESPLRDSLTIPSVAAKWINMDSDDEGTPPPPESGVAAKWINMNSDQESVGTDSGAEDSTNAAGTSQAAPLNMEDLTVTPSHINITPRKFHSAEFDMLPIELFDLDEQTDEDLEDDDLEDDD